MTMEDATKIFYINIEIRNIKLELARLQERKNNRSFSRALHYSGMPKGNGIIDTMTESDRLIDEEAQLMDMLRYSLKRLQVERLKIEKLLMAEPDAEMRLILRLRCVNNMTWQEIGDEIGMNRTTVSRKFYSYFEKNESCTQCTS